MTVSPYLGPGSLQPAVDTARAHGGGLFVLARTSNPDAGTLQLVGEPSVVLADEPTGNLDTRSGDALVGLLHELNDQGTTVVVITHDTELAARLPRRIAMRDGRVVSDSTTPEVAA